MSSLDADRAPGVGLRLEHDHPPARVGEQVGGDEAVRTRSDDDRVVAIGEGGG